MQSVVSMGLFVLAGVFFLKVAWNLTVPFELARRKDERAGEKGDRPQGFPKSLNPQHFCQRLFRGFSKTRPFHGKSRSIWRTLSLN